MLHALLNLHVPAVMVHEFLMNLQLPANIQQDAWTF
jgi:hypothetical protein